jgi:hypothetical protein
MIVGVLATLSAVAHAQLSNTQIMTIQAVCPKTVKGFCDALPSIRDAMNGTGGAQPSSCNSTAGVVTSPRFKILVALSSDSKCSQVNLDCNNDQGAGVLNQVLSLVLCIVSGVGTTLGNTLSAVSGAVNARSTLIQVVLLILYVLLSKLIKALCGASLSVVVAILPLAVFILLVGVAYGLVNVLFPVSVALVVLAVTLTTLLLPVTILLGGVINVLPVGTIITAVSNIANTLFGTPKVICSNTGSLSSTLSALIATAFSLFNGVLPQGSG